MEDGAPSVVQRTLIKPPRSRLGPIDAKERAIIQSVSPLAGKYDQRVDRESAEEVLARKAADAAATAEEVAEKGREEVGKRERKSTSIWEKAMKRAASAAAGSGAAHRRRGDHRQEVARQPDQDCGFIRARFDRHRPRRTARRPLRAQPDRRADALVAHRPPPHQRAASQAPSCSRMRG